MGPSLQSNTSPAAQLGGYQSGLQVPGLNEDFKAFIISSITIIIHIPLMAPQMPSHWSQL